MNTKYSLTIGWLYPDLMSTYGDRGNIICLQKRCEWRGIKVEVKKLDLGFKIEDLKECNFLFMGGAQDIQQQIVEKDLRRKAKILSEMIEDNIPGLYICGAYQFLGKYYKEADGTILDGLAILDLYTENPGTNHSRLIGNIITKALIFQNSRSVLANPPPKWNYIGISGESYFIGFENHGGRTYLGKNIKPLAIVVKGFGNNGNLPAMLNGRQVQAGDKTEGVIYKNSIGSYMHGPFLPKNPHFADWLIAKSLEVKYQTKINLYPLDDTLEWQAHKAIAKRLGVSV